MGLCWSLVPPLPFAEVGGTGYTMGPRWSWNPVEIVGISMKEAPSLGGNLTILALKKVASHERALCAHEK